MTQGSVGAVGRGAVAGNQSVGDDRDVAVVRKERRVVQASPRIARTDEEHQSTRVTAVVGEVVRAERAKVRSDPMSHLLEQQVSTGREVLVVDQRRLSAGDTDLRGTAM